MSQQQGDDGGDRRQSIAVAKDWRFPARSYNFFGSGMYIQLLKTIIDRQRPANNMSKFSV